MALGREKVLLSKDQILSNAEDKMYKIIRRDRCLPVIKILGCFVNWQSWI